MRRLVLLCLIVLLPLRAWAGDWMGLQMALDSPAAEVAAMPADCPMHAQAGEQAAPAHADGSACSACDLCIPMAAWAAQPVTVSAGARHGAPQAPDRADTSALPAPTLEPPIP